MLDNYSSFRIVRDRFKFYNFFQFFSSRYGLGRSMSSYLCDFSGINYRIKLGRILDNYYFTDYTNSYLLKRIQSFFYLKNNFLDDSLWKR